MKTLQERRQELHSVDHKLVVEQAVILAGAFPGTVISLQYVKPSALLEYGFGPFDGLMIKTFENGSSISAYPLAR